MSFIQKKQSRLLFSNLRLLCGTFDLTSFSFDSDTNQWHNRRVVGEETSITAAFNYYIVCVKSWLWRCVVVVDQKCLLRTDGGLGEHSETAAKATVRRGDYFVYCCILRSDNNSYYYDRVQPNATLHDPFNCPPPPPRQQTTPQYLLSCQLIPVGQPKPTGVSFHLPTNQW